MGFVGDMLSGGKGAGYQAQGVDPAQLNTSYTQTQDAIKQQKNFVKALKGQNGLENQSNVFGQQQALANQLQGMSQGQGPNPALAQLNQTTGQNMANQAALMASQRGASANTGLMARQAAMVGANTQQQAVGQAATLRAQQQLAAIQQLQNQQASMGNMANTQVGQYQTGLTQYNNSALQQQANLMGLQANINNANAQIAAGNQRGQQNMLGGMMGAAGGAMQLFGGGGGGAASGAGGLMAGGAGDAGGLTGGGLASGATMLAADGGPVPDMDANPLTPMQPAQMVAAPAEPQPSNGPKSSVGKMFNDQSSMMLPAGAGGATLAASATPGGKPEEDASKSASVQGLGTIGSVAGGVLGGVFGGPIGAMGGSALGGALGRGLGGAIAKAEGGPVPALVSPGERYLTPTEVQKARSGVNPLKLGEKIPGKPVVGGAKNDYANDIVPKTLEAGGLVLPRSITMAKNPGEKARKFVEACLAKQRAKGK